MELIILEKLQKEIVSILEEWEYDEPQLNEASYSEIIQFQEASRLLKSIEQCFGCLYSAEILKKRGYPDKLSVELLKPIFFSKNLKKRLLRYSQCGYLGLGLLKWAQENLDLKNHVFDEWTNLDEYCKTLIINCEIPRLDTGVETEWWSLDEEYIT